MRKERAHNPSGRYGKITPEQKELILSPDYKGHTRKEVSEMTGLAMSSIGYHRRKAKVKGPKPDYSFRGSKDWSKDSLALMDYFGVKGQKGLDRLLSIIYRLLIKNKK